MSSIGSINFIRFSWPQIPALAPAVEIIDRPGVDGTADRVNALKSEELTIYTIQSLSSENDAKNAADTYAAKKGTRVTVVDDMGREVEEVLVVDVRVLNVRNVLIAIPASMNYRIDGVWLLKPTKAL